MIRKTAFLIPFFILLLILNLFLSFKLLSFYYKEKQIKTIFTQINNPTDDLFLNSANKKVLGIESNVYFSDGRVANLKSFFRKYNSPLYDYADLIVKVSDKYKFDYRLLPAIAMQESNLCRYIPEDSHNCWGWGIYGDKITKFSSYEEAIETVARGIKEQYIDKGYITASKIMEKYTPSSNGSWAHGVNTFLRLLE
jgi:hypothetical protein